MSKRFLALCAALFGAGVATAADPAKPAIEFRLKSVTDLLPLIEYGGDLAGQADKTEQVTAIIREVVRQKMGLKGVDLSRPVGGYVIAAENPADSPIVLMLPVAGEEAFLGALEDDAHFSPKKEKDGTHTLTVPNFPASVHLRFAHDYAYLGFRSAAGIAKDKLLTPKDFFAAKTDAAFAATIFPDRIPVDLRKAAYGQLEMHLNESVRGPDPVQKAAQKFLVDRAADMAKAVLMDGEKLSLTLSGDPKTDDLALELTLTPKAGSGLATTISGWADRPSTAASFAHAVKAPAFAAAVNFALPGETKAALNRLIDTAVEASLAKAKPNDKIAAKLVLDAVLPTLKSGELGLGVAVTGPDSKGKFGGMAALRTVDGKKIDTASRVMSVAIPAEVAAVKYDADKVGDGQLHTITVPGLAKEPAKTVGNTFHAYSSDPLLAVSLSNDVSELKGLLAAPPAKTPMLHAEVSVMKLFRMTKNVPAATLTRMTEEAFGKPVRDGDDVIKLTGTGGKELRLKLTAKGRALAFIRVVNQ